MAQRVKWYAIEGDGEPELIRGTAKRAQVRVREIHREGRPATLRCIRNKAELRDMLEAA